jgi:hypothetical protein
MRQTKLVSATALSAAQWAQLIREAAKADAQRGGLRSWSYRYATLLTCTVLGVSRRVLAKQLREARAELHHTEAANGGSDRSWVVWFGQYLEARFARSA